MKKLFSFKRLMLVLALVFSLFIFASCEPKAKADGSVTIEVINYEEEKIFNEKVEFFTGDTLVKILQEHKELNVQGTTSEYGLFITSIKGIDASTVEKGWWSFQINGKDAEVGISSVELKNGDTYTFILLKGNW